MMLFEIADHVCGHADAAVAVRVKRVFEILCDGKILGRIERLRRRLGSKTEWTS